MKYWWAYKEECGKQIRKSCSQAILAAYSKPATSPGGWVISSYSGFICLSRHGCFKPFGAVSYQALVAVSFQALVAVSSHFLAASYQAYLAVLFQALCGCGKPCVAVSSPCVAASYQAHLAVSFQALCGCCKTFWLFKLLMVDTEVS